MDMKTRLVEIGDGLNAYSFPSAPKTNQDFINGLLPLMRWTNELLQIGVAMVRTKKDVSIGITRPKATIVGMMVRLGKLYHAFLQHVENGQEDIASIFTRLIYETEVKMSYLIANPQSWRSYILTSLRSEKEMLEDLRNKSKSRKLIPIEVRIRKSVKKTLKQEGITEKELISCKWKDIDGKNFRSMLQSLGRENEYVYGFGGSSRNVHGSWLDLHRYHLKKVGRGFQPNIRYRKPDPRYAGPLTYRTLEGLLAYISWSKTDRTGVVGLLGEQLLKDVRKLDDMHEKLLNTKGH